MEFNTPITAEKKQCPFCAELILAKAIKCRYCGEFLNTLKAKSVQQTNSQNNNLPGFSGPDDDGQSSGAKKNTVLFTAKPSILGMTGTVIRGMFFIAFAIFLIGYPVENWVKYVSAQADKAKVEFNKSGDAPATIDRQVIMRYRKLTGIVLIALVVMVLLIKATNLKCTRYEVTTERIEWSRGILDRKVDNIDMFRIIDISLRRSLLDCIFFIGSVIVMTTDKTDPKFEFLKIHHSRRLYDIIKAASLKADNRNTVVHVEN